MNRHILAGHADIAAPNFSVANQPARHEFRGVTCDRETDSLCRPDHGGVHPNNFTRRINERSARIARVQGGISLDDIVDQAARLRMHGASERADHARCDARLKAERIPDGNYNLPDAQVFRVGQSDVGQVWRIDANDREIGIGIISDQLSVVFASILQIHPDLGRAVHDVPVGQNESVRRDDES